MRPGSSAIRRDKFASGSREGHLRAACTSGRLSLSDKRAAGLIDAAQPCLYAGISSVFTLAMATIDEDLNQVERDIRTLKIEYEQFFGGGRPRPPADTQWRVDTMIRRYNERTGELTFAQRFRFNNLAQTYAKYVDMWRKKTMQKETGQQQHHFGAAARAIEAERARAAAAREAAAPPPEPAMAAKSKRAAVREAAAAFAMSFSNPESEKDKVNELYNKLIEVRTQTGEIRRAQPEGFREIRAAENQGPAGQGRPRSGVYRQH